MASEKDKTSSTKSDSDTKATASDPKTAAKGGSGAASKPADPSGGPAGAKPASEGTGGTGRTGGPGSTGTGGTGTGAGGPAGAGRSGSGRAKPLTIDLTAQEVRAAEARAAEDAKSGSGSKPGSGPAAAERSSSTDPKADKATPEGAAGARRDGAGPTGGSDGGRKPPADPGTGGGGMGRMVAAAGIGGVIALGLGWGALQTGLIQPAGGDVASLRSALEQSQERIAALDAQVRELSGTEAAPTVAPAVVNDLAARLQDLEARAGGSEGLAEELDTVRGGLEDLRRFVSSGGAGSSAALASLGDSLESLQTQVAQIGDKVGEMEDGASPALQQALDDLDARIAALDGRTKAAAEAASAAAKAASEGDALAGNTLQAFSGRVEALSGTVKEAGSALDRLTARIGTLEGAAEATRENVAATQEAVAALDTRLEAVEKVVGGPGARETASRAIAVSMLKNAVDAGRPFATELAAVRNALPAEVDLQPLEREAETGIATIAELTAAFPEVAARMAGTLERVDTGNSVADRFLNNMRSLVSVRATGDGAGSGPMGALGQMEQQVRSGDLAAALKTFETLPEGAQAVGRSWAASARARVEADRLVDRVTGEVIEALAKDS